MEIINLFYRLGNSVENDVCLHLETFNSLIKSDMENNTVEIMSTVTAIKRINDAMYKNAKISFLTECFDSLIMNYMIEKNLIITAIVNEDFKEDGPKEEVIRPSMFNSNFLGENK